MTEEPPSYPARTHDANTLDPQTIEQLVKNQAFELELRARELDLQQQQDRHSFEFSRASLDAQIIDRQDERVFQRKQRRDAYILAAIISFALCGVVAFAMWANKDQIALEIIKSVVLLLSGGAGGYAIGRHRAAKSSPTDADPPAS